MVHSFTGYCLRAGEGMEILSASLQEVPQVRESFPLNPKKISFFFKKKCSPPRTFTLPSRQPTCTPLPQGYFMDLYSDVCPTLVNLPPLGYLPNPVITFHSDFTETGLQALNVDEVWCCDFPSEGGHQNPLDLYPSRTHLDPPLRGERTHWGSQSSDAEGKRGRRRPGFVRVGGKITVYSQAQRWAAVQRWRQKKQQPRNQPKPYACRQIFANQRPRVAGRFVCLPPAHERRTRNF